MEPSRIVRGQAAHHDHRHLRQPIVRAKAGGTNSVSDE